MAKTIAQHEHALVSQHFQVALDEAPRGHSEVASNLLRILNVTLAIHVLE